MIEWRVRIATADGSGMMGAKDIQEVTPRDSERAGRVINERECRA
jgi:hypothetical protein